jgi:hypothetical protein
VAAKAHELADTRVLDCSSRGAVDCRRRNSRSPSWTATPLDYLQHVQCGIPLKAGTKRRRTHSTNPEMLKLYRHFSGLPKKAALKSPSILSVGEWGAALREQDHHAYGRGDANILRQLYK